MDPSILLAARVLGTLVFGMAVIGKLRHREEFVGVVANYRLLPDVLAAPVAWLVVILETLVVLALVTGIALLGIMKLLNPMLEIFGPEYAGAARPKK